MLNTCDSMREGTNKQTYTTTKHITTLLLRSRVKNPIRSSMLDNWTSAMMVLGSETDILENLSNDEIIDKFTEISRIYSSLLVKK